MSFVHGKDTVFIVNSVDLSAYTKTSDLERTADVHDVTTYGKTAHVYAGGLHDGKGSASGVYDNTAGTGPRAVLRAALGLTVPVIRRPEGTGAGRPQDAVSVVVGKYTETNPADDMVSWQVELQLTDAVTSTTQ